MCRSGGEISDVMYIMIVSRYVATGYVTFCVFYVFIVTVMQL